MKILGLILAVLLLCSPILGQTTATGKVLVATSTTLPATCSGGDLAVTTDTFTLYECGPANTWVIGFNKSVLTGAGAPTGSCSSTQVFVDTSTGNFYSCKGTTWQFVGPGTGNVAWASLSPGTLSTAGNYIVNSGVNLFPAGSGSIVASAAPWSGITGFPSGCSSGQFVTTIGVIPSCSSLAYSQVTGTPTIFYQVVGNNGSSQTARNRINLIPGSNVSISSVDNSGTNSTDVTITSSPPSAFYQLVGINGTSQTPRNRLNLIPGVGMSIIGVDNSGTNSTDTTVNFNQNANFGFTGTNTHSGSETFSGQTTVSNPCAIDGILYVSGSGCYTSFSAALAQCQIQGSCIIDARGASTVTNIGTFDPNINSTTNAAVTLLLGPYNYSVTQIVLRSNLQVYGSGYNAPSGTPGTVLTQASASIAPIALPTSGGPTITIAQGVRLSNFVLAPASGSTADGISIVAAPNTVCSPQPSCQATNPGGGLWYSSFDHLFIAGFGRNEIRIDGTQCGQCSATQFFTGRDIWAFRNQNAPPVLYITGAYLGQTTWDGGEFDGAGASGPSDTSSNLENIHIDDTAGLGAQTFVPYSIKFQNVTSQWAFGSGGVALGVHGAFNVICDNGHFEHDATVVSAVAGPGGHGAWGTIVENSYIDGFSGSGGLVNIDGNSSLSFHDNTEGTNPPSGGFLVSGSVPTNLQWYGNTNSVGGTSFSPLPEPTLTVSQLPPVSEAIGVKRIVSDSTTVSTEGQVCVGGSSNKAIAISNGSSWKCF